MKKCQECSNNLKTVKKNLYKCSECEKHYYVVSEGEEEVLKEANLALETK